MIRDLKSKHPDIELPCIKLALFLNGEDNEEWERRWYYDGARCAVSKPGENLRFFEVDDSSTNDSGDDAEEVAGSRGNRVEDMNAGSSAIGDIDYSI